MNDMDAATIKRLYDLLTRQAEAHDEMRAVLLTQQRALRRFDTAGLEQLRQRCDVLTERIAELENARRAVTGPDVRISDLAATVGEPDRSRLVAVAIRLKKAAEEIASIHRINRAAVANMLNHFHQAYQLLASADNAAAYGSSGQSTDRPSGAFLVDAVA